MEDKLTFSQKIARASEYINEGTPLKDALDPDEIDEAILILNALLELERLVRENESELLWEYCDCGCPSASNLKSKGAVDIYRILKALDSYK